MSEFSEQEAPSIGELLSTWAGNFKYQTTKAVTNLKTKDYIRLVIIIGGYCLLRPYLMKLGAKLQARQHERDSAMSVEPGSAMDGNDLRGKKKMPIPGLDSDDEDDEEESSEVTAGDWGRNARIRQRNFIRQKLEEHEQRLREEAEAASDKEIEEFLVD
jgi:hypothetical protein